MKGILISLIAVAALAMSCARHLQHTESHVHGPACGHVAINHEGHTDYLHDGHLHSPHGSHADEHRLAVNATNPAQCTPNHSCTAHPKDHTHGATCGHQQVPHGDHTDYLVDGHLHHPHTGHCDTHGPVQLAGKSSASEQDRGGWQQQRLAGSQHFTVLPTGFLSTPP